MLVAQLLAPRTFHLTEQTLEDPGPGEIQVRVNAVGICGSDVHSYAEGAIGDTPCEYPMVLGHEPAGTVVKTGSGVTGWHAGDRGSLLIPKPYQKLEGPWKGGVDPAGQA